MKWFEDERIRTIVDYVQWRRVSDRIAVVRGRKPELSGEMFGEFRILLEVQLLTTPEFGDSWLELRESDETPNASIVAGVLQEAAKDLRRRQLQGKRSWESQKLLSRLSELAAPEPSGRPR